MKCVFALIQSIAITAALSSAAAQSLSGTVAASDTGSVLTRGTIVAVQRTAIAGQRPQIYKSDIDANGKYTLPALPGQYQICVSGAEPYLDPCQWGSPAAASIAGVPVVSALSLQKGVQLILRVHDPGRLLPTAEAVHGTAVKVFVSGPGVSSRALMLLADGGIFRDYAEYVPFNTSLTLLVKSTVVNLSSSSGTPLPAAGAPVQVLPSDFQASTGPVRALSRMFPKSTAKVIHVYASAIQ